MTFSEENSRRLDSTYKAFPAFAQWSQAVTVDATRWNRYNASLQKNAELSPDILAKAREHAKRAAALDTGAIEGLYETDRGFTYTVAFETAAWEALLNAKGESVRPLFESQLHAYDFVLDLATKAEPITEASIRALHEVMCSAQDTYQVATAIGFQEQPLRKGEYKSLPNHVRTRKGEDHAYAPVDLTGAEMYRLVNELRSEAFLAAHPIIQASYAHYAFVVIHPFADGNGRVARALASVFTYRAISMPIVILTESKPLYLDALEQADAGEFQSFVAFMELRAFDTMELVEASIRRATVVDLNTLLGNLKNLYSTKSGYSQDEIDTASVALLTKLLSIFAQKIDLRTDGKIHGIATIQSGHFATGIPATHRYPMGPSQRTINIQLSSEAPAQALEQRSFLCLVPKDAAGTDDLIIRNAAGSEAITARVDEALPKISGMLEMRITLFVERILSDMAFSLLSKAKLALGTPTKY